MQLTNELSISGMPVVDDGELMGIVTSRDFRYADNPFDPVSSIMTPKDKLITVIEGTDQEEVKKLMYNNRIEKILVIDSIGSLTGLVTMKDIEKSAEHPFATKDSRGQLRVGAALGTGEDTLDRAKALSIAGVDLFVVDSAHGHSKNVVETIKLIKKEFKDIDVMGGNVATPEGAIALRDAGADAIKIGMGPGSICTTRIIAGMGVPQITAILSIKEKFKSNDVPLIADGGIRFSGDVSKALAAGADAVMLGGIFAGQKRLLEKLSSIKAEALRHIEAWDLWALCQKEMMLIDTLKTVLKKKKWFQRVLKGEYLSKDGLLALLTS